MNILQYLIKKLLIEKNNLMRFSNTAPYRYKIYQIPKRNSNKKRTIAQPSRELKYIQKEIVNYLSCKLPLHDAAYAYREKRSIKNNAEIHKNSNYLLKMDLENFFPSITPEIFFSVLKKIDIQIDEDNRFILKNLLFYKTRENKNLRLSIGAPSSPLLSNFIMFFLDKDIQLICQQLNVNYTRYADDLTFSTNKKNTLCDIPEIISSLLETHFHGKLKINKDKTIFSSKRHNRHVTGITITNDNQLSLGRERKRRISSMLHYFINGKLNNDEIDKLRGIMAFAKHVDFKFYNKMIHKYNLENVKVVNNN